MVFREVSSKKAARGGARAPEGAFRRGRKSRGILAVWIKEVLLADHFRCVL